MLIEPIVISNADLGIVVTHMQVEHTAALSDMQDVTYPTLDEDSRFKAAHYRRHLELFPEGQFVALDRGRPVGSTSTFRTQFDDSNLERYRMETFLEAIDHGWFGNHQPTGDWLYGADIQVHPDYRGKGLARMLYAARKAAVRSLNLRGMLAVGMFPGYYRYETSLTIDDYVAKVVSDEIFDPTLSVQIRQGFRYVLTVYDYIQDASSGNGSALIVWDNPDYRPT